MSFDSQPSFRTRFKGKLKEKLLKNNITLLIHQNSTSNDTKTRWSQKIDDIKDSVKDITHYETFKNKTKGFISDTFSSNDNQTSPKGFYDSLFSPETVNDVYLKVIIMSLWVIAVLCIIPAIITVFLPSGRNQNRPFGVNLIFFHVFLCELFYLIYILLSMINVALDFQLISFFCGFANYGMYVTIPVTYLALFWLSIQRVTRHCDSTNTCAKIFTNTCIIQTILWAIWGSFAIITIFIFKKTMLINEIKNKAIGYVPTIFEGVIKKIDSDSGQCSIDGHLSSVYKILMIILFILLIILIAKSMIFSIGFSFFTPNCCAKNRAEETRGNRRMTILFVIFLFLNLFFSFPFYFISIFDVIFKNIDSTKTTFTTLIKICFILRILGIILECLTFCMFQRSSWNFISKLVYHGTCDKFPALNIDSDDDDDDFYTNKPTTRNHSQNNQRYKGSKTMDKTDDDDDDDDDGGFQRQTKSKQLRIYKPEITVKIKTEQDRDDAKPLVRKSKPSNRKEDVADISPQSIDSKDDDVFLDAVATKSSNIDNIVVRVPNGKVVSHRISSTTPNKEPPKSIQQQPNNIKHRSSQRPPSSGDVTDSSTTSSVVINEQKKKATVLPNVHRIEPSTSAQPTAVVPLNHYRVTTRRRHRTTTIRRRSPRRVNSFNRKLTNNRASEILGTSIEV